MLRWPKSTLVSISLFTATLAHAQTSPQWWTDRSVVDTQATANDYAAANVGQAKHFTWHAIAELDEKLSVVGGAGFDFNDLLSPNAEVNDYAMINAGQLKFLSSAFINRMADLGKWGFPANPSPQYKWPNPTSSTNDYAAVNLGQLKNVFNWDVGTLATVVSTDSDGDGLPDAWETHHGFDPNDPDVGNADGARGDPDNDGLSNLRELIAGTDPNDADTDNDNLSDEWEVFYFGRSDFYDDTHDVDQDGYVNKHEYDEGTDPTNYLSRPNDEATAINSQYTAYAPSSGGTVNLAPNDYERYVLGENMYLGWNESADPYARFSDWFGWYFVTSTGFSEDESSRWIFHESYGWLWIHSRDNDGVWMYDYEIGWTLVASSTNHTDPFNLYTPLLDEYLQYNYNSDDEYTYVWNGSTQSYDEIEGADGKTDSIWYHPGVGDSQEGLDPEYHERDYYRYTFKEDTTDHEIAELSEHLQITNGTFVNYDEATYGNPHADNDDDGLSNIQEVLMGLNPSVGTDAKLGDHHADPERAIAALSVDVSTSASGQLSINVPFSISPGTAGLQPELGVSYSSGGGNGLLGMGWSLAGMSSITRGPETLAVDNDQSPIDFGTDDQFYLDGSRLILVSGTHGQSGAKYRTEIDSGNEVEIGDFLSPSGQVTGIYFVVRTKAGLTMEYGYRRDTRFYANGNVNKTISFLLGKVRDRSENYYEIRYWKHSQQEMPVPLQILYTGNGTPTQSGTGFKQEPYNEILFEYELRDDSFSGFIAGAPAENNLRMKRITAYGKDAQTTGITEKIFRTYDFKYKKSEATERSLLLGIVSRGEDGVEILPTVFDWQEEKEDKSWQASWKNTGPADGDFGYPNHPLFQGDYDGDGMGDIAIMDGAGSSQWKLWLHASDGTQFVKSTMLDTSTTGWAATYKYDVGYYENHSNYDSRLSQGDYDGDGDTDFLKYVAFENNAWQWYNIFGGTTNPAGYYFIEGDATGSSWQANEITNIKDKNGSTLTPYSGQLMNPNYPWFWKDQDVVEGDFNGDGITDLATHRNDVKQLQFSLFDGVDTLTHTSVAGLPLDFGNARARLRAADFNGDGLTDVFVWINSSFYVCYSNSDGTFSLHQQTNISRANYDKQRLLPADINADGLMDLVIIDHSEMIIFQNQGENGTNRATLFSDQTIDFEAELATDETYAGPYGLNTGGQASGYLTEWRIADFFGDGFPDLLQIQSAHGSGGNAYCVVYDVCPCKESGRYTIKRVVLNLHDAYHELINLENGGPRLLIPFVGDFSGNGKADLIISQDNGTEFYGWSGTTALQDRINVVTNGFGVKTEVDYAPLNNSDGTIYTKGTDAVSRLGAGHIDFVTSQHVVKEIRKDLGSGTLANPDQSTHTYHYSGLVSSKDRGNLGFREVQVIDSYGSALDTRTTTTYRQEFPYTGSVEKTTTEVKVGSNWKLVSEEEVTNVAKKEIAGSISGQKVYIPINSIMIEKSYELDGTTQIGYTRTDQPKANIDDWGNIGRIIVDSGDGFKTETINTYGTTAEYERFGRLTRAQVKKTIDGGSTWSTRTSSFEYDPTTLLLKKEIVEPDQAYSTKLKEVTEYTYDDFGNVIKTEVSAHDRNTSGTYSLKTREVSTVYDTWGRFPTESTNVLGHTSKTTYNGINGTLVSEEDINGLTTSYQYDVLGRVVKTIPPAGSTDKAYVERMRATDHSSTAPSDAVYVEKVWTDSIGESNASVTYFDRLGREVRTIGRNAFGDALLTWTKYGERGLATETSRPYKSGETLTDADFSYTWFDELGRPVLMKAPGGQFTGFSYGPRIGSVYGAVTIQYQLLTGTITAPAKTATSINIPALFNGKDYTRTTTTTNAIGQTVVVEDNDNFLLEHFYDAQGNLKESRRLKPGTAQYISTTMQYDIRGRKTSMTDPDMGTWTYVYNGFGELTEQTDAVGSKVLFAYDTLGRLTQRKDVKSDTTLYETTTWHYDETTSTQGLLYQITTTSGYQKDINYNSNNQVTSEVEKIVSTNYTFSYTYDTYGRPVKTTYPGGFATENLYNSNGALTKVRKYNDANTVYWEGQSGDATGGYDQFKLGNGLITRLDRDLKTGFLDSIKTGTSATTQQRQNLAFQYNLIGHLTEREDLNRDLRETFTYDDLQRLHNVKLYNAGVLQFDKNHAYDSLGNLKTKVTLDGGTLTLNYDYNGKPHALTSDSRNYQYFYYANGNLQRQKVTSAGDIQYYSWTPFNKVNAMTRYHGGTSSVTSFYYGADRQRVRQYINKPGIDYEEIVYVGGGLYEKHITFDGTGTTVQRHYVATPMGNVAVYVDDSSSANRTEYLHHDHQGSLSEVTSVGGTTVASYSYDSWGALRDPDDWKGVPQASQSIEEEQLLLNRGYTGHEHLSLNELVHMNGRLYDPVLGRMISADPNVPLPDDLQTHNRYTYVLNNPLSYTDPSGYFFDKIFGAIGDFFSDYWRPIVAIAAGAATYGVLGPGIGFLGIQGAGHTFGAAVAAGAVAGGINDGVRGAAWGAAFGAAFWGVGEAFALHGLAEPAFGSAGYFAKTVAHGAVGGGMAIAQGGEFQHGFLAAAAAQASSPVINGIGNGGMDFEYVVARVSVAATVGGTVSELSGGSFGNGAITGAFSRLFNHELPHLREDYYATTKAEAFSKAKFEAGIAKGDVAYKTQSEFLTDRDGKRLVGKDGKFLTGRTLFFLRADKTQVAIQHHPHGHPNFKDSRPHFNVRPVLGQIIIRNGLVGGTRGHYFYGVEPPKGANVSGTAAGSTRNQKLSPKMNRAFRKDQERRVNPTK